MDNIKVRCEQSFYKEIYQFSDTKTKQTIVLDETTRSIWLKKYLDVYDIRVFEYLKEHPNLHIPGILTYWETNEQLIVIEEYITGQTLEQLLEEKSLSEERKHRLLIDLCDGMAFLHSAVPPIIHRDIKSGNIMITNDGILKIVDYDAAKIFRQNSERDTRLIGTYGNAAPEQYGFAQSDARTDIYAIGVLIREMFPDEQAYLEIVRKATEFHPRDRYQNIEELKNAVNQIRTSGFQETAKPAAHGKECDLDASESITARNNLSKRSWIPPGFRGTNPWQKLVAGLGYAVLFFLTLTLHTEGESSVLWTWCVRLCFLTICLAVIDLLTDYTGIYRNAPLIRHPYFIVRVTGYILGVIRIIIFHIVFFAIILQQFG